MPSIRQVLDELNVHYCKPGEHHHVRQGWIGLNCPWCLPSYGGKGMWRLGIEISTGRCSCWVCGRHSLVEAVAAVAKLPLGVAAALLKGVQLEKYVPKGAKIGGTLKRPKGIEPLLPAHKRYLRQRGFDPISIERLWNVQGIGVANRLSWRLYIPIILNGEEVSWTTRTIGNRPSRYLSAKPEEERLNLKDTLYGIDLVRSTIVIVEGPTDAWNVGPGSSATLGVDYTPSQVSLMVKFPHRVVCFDNSIDAQKRARELCTTLSLFPGKTTNVCLDAEDPGSASIKEIKRLRRAVLD